MFNSNKYKDNHRNESALKLNCMLLRAGCSIEKPPYNVNFDVSKDHLRLAEWNLSKHNTKFGKKIQ